jgi:hypothetical protein
MLNKILTENKKIVANVFFQTLTNQACLDKLSPLKNIPTMEPETKLKMEFRMIYPPLLSIIGI